MTNIKLQEEINRMKDFQGANLSGEDFSGVDLQKADFNGADIRGTNFHGAHLEGANFHGVNGSGANFTKAHLDRASFSYADISYCNFHQASLVEAQFNSTRGEDVYFSRADGRRASFMNADIRRSNFERTDLREADLCNAELKGCTLYKTKRRKKDKVELRQMMAIHWGVLSDALTLELMRWDCDNLPHGEQLFRDWANGGYCPFAESHHTRLLHFIENPIYGRPGNLRCHSSK